MAGVHVPVIAVGVLVEDVGNAGIVAPLQYGPTAAKVGVIGVGAVRVMELSWVLKGATQS